MSIGKVLHTSIYIEGRKKRHYGVCQPMYCRFKDKGEFFLVVDLRRNSELRESLFFKERIKEKSLRGKVS